METPPRIAKLYECHCGWARKITDTVNWRNNMIEHPAWGYMTQLDAAWADVNNHNCHYYRKAVSHSTRAQAISRGERLPEYPVRPTARTVIA